MTQVYKFGGASIASPERASALIPIIQAAPKPLVIVVSAYGKTTNALEEIVWSLIANNRDKAKQLTDEIVEKHQEYAQSLLSEEGSEACLLKLSPFFSRLYQNLDLKEENPDKLYDQIVGLGELLSTTIFAALLAENQLKTEWMDARQLIRTDAHFRDAHINEIATREKIREKILPCLQENEIVITQGFIGGTENNLTTTLGREGSDYSGAILAAMLSADTLQIWKDVEGLLNADPRTFPEAVKIPEISFHEVIEMAFYGAQVIHPKTIKPLQNAAIPLYVKCFLKPEFSGTLIHHTEQKIAYPPLIVLKDNQSLLEVSSRDFSFINEGNLSLLYHIFHQNQVKINMIQNAAISIVFVVNNEEQKIQNLIAALEKDYKVLRNDHQQLLTIRHYQPALVEKLTEGKNIILTQKTRSTIQMVLE